MGYYNVRVELRHNKNGVSDKQAAQKMIVKEFMSRYKDSFVPNRVSEIEFFESKGEKKRKKHREAIMRQQQEKILDAIESGESPASVRRNLKKKS